MALPLLTRLRSNCKGHTDIALDRITYIQGPNRSRKTGILDAVRLALTGKHPAGPHPVDLVGLAPAFEQSLYSTLSSDEGEISFHMNIIEGKARKPEPVNRVGAYEDLGPTDVIVLDEVLKLLGYGDKKLREALMRLFGEASEEVLTCPDGLNTQQQEVWREALQATASEPDPADRLAAMAEWARKTSLATTKKAGSQVKQNVELEKQVQAGLQGGADLLPQYEGLLKRAEAWESSVEQRKSLADHIAGRDRLQTQLDKLPPRLAGVDDSIAMLKLALKLMKDDCTTCPTCLGVTAKQELAGRLANLDGSQRDSSLEDSLKAVKNEIASLERKLEGVPTNYEGKPAAELRATINQLQAVQHLRKQLLSSTEEIYRLQERSGLCKVIERESAKKLSTVLHQVQDAAEEQINAFMPDDFVAELQVSETRTALGVIGSDGRTHGKNVMCGSEFGALIVGLSCALAAKRKASFLLLDDKDIGAFDARNLGALLLKLDEATKEGLITQVLIAGWRNDLPEWVPTIRVTC